MYDKDQPEPPFAAASAGPSVLSSIRYTRAYRGSAVSLRPGHCCVNQALPASRHRSQAPFGGTVRLRTHRHSPVYKRPKANTCSADPHKGCRLPNLSLSKLSLSVSTNSRAL